MSNIQLKWTSLKQVCHAMNEQKYSPHSDTCQPNNVCPQAKTSFLPCCNAHVTQALLGSERQVYFFYAKCLKCDAPGWHYIVLYLPPCSSFFNKCKYFWRRWLFFYDCKHSWHFYHLWHLYVTLNLVWQADVARDHSPLDGSIALG